MKRKSFSLLEIIISLPLFALLLITLLQNYSVLFKLSDQQNKHHYEILQKRYSHHRLKRIFSTLLEHTKENEMIFLPGKSLEFKYNNGVNRNPLASNEVYAHLFLDYNELILDVYKESEKKTFIRHEILFENVENIRFSFAHELEGEIKWLDKIEDVSSLAAIKVYLNNETKGLFFEL